MSLITKRIYDWHQRAQRYPIYERTHSIISTLAQDLIRCDLPKQASAMAYATLLSLIPSLAVIFCVISIFNPMLGEESSVLPQIQGFIIDNLAAGSGQAVVEKINAMLSNLSLARIGWTSFGVMIFTLITLLKQIEGALNRIWLVRRGRNMFTRFMHFWTFLTLGMASLAMALGVAARANIDKLMPLAGDVPQSFLGAKVGAFAGGFLFFFFLYKVVPNCFVATRNAAVGALISAILIREAGRAYGIFIQDFSNYEAVYGALAALPLFLLWLWITWLVILFGSAVSWRLQQGFPKPTEADTLDGAETPVERLRNIQVKAWLPLIGILSIYKSFSEATGKGLTIDSLAQQLKLPLGWVTDALDALESLGYAVAKDRGPDEVSSEYFPAFPASAVTVERLNDDLGRPMGEWIQSWKHELPIDLATALETVGNPDSETKVQTIENVVASLPPPAEFVDS